MTRARGDLVTVALQGDHGKPRPALVIQSDLFPDTATIVVLLISSTPVDAPLLRIAVAPSEGNGLRTPSQVMVDKPIAVPVRKVGPTFGRIEPETLVEVTRALALVLGLAV